MRVMLKDVYAWVRYTLATKVNSTRSTLLKVELTESTVSLWPRTHWWQSRKDVQHSGDGVGNSVNRDKLSNSSCCWFVAKTGNKVDRIRRQSTSLPICRAGFGSSRLSTKSTVLNSTLSPVCTGLYSQLNRGRWTVMMKDLRCRDVCVMQWVCTQRVRMTLVQCCACVRRCNLTPLDKIWHLQCCSFIETGHLLVMSPNRSNQRQFIVAFIHRTWR